MFGLTKARLSAPSPQDWPWSPDPPSNAFLIMRIQPITPGTQPELVTLEAAIQAARGRISPLYQVLLHSPAIAHGWEQMLSAVRNHSSLEAGLRELVILRVAVLNHANYEFEAHIPHALKAGITQAAIEATRICPLPAGAPWSLRERLALEATDALTRELHIRDEAFAQLQVHFSAQEQVELFATIGAYNMVSRFLNAFQIGH